MMMMSPITVLVKEVVGCCWVSSHQASDLKNLQTVITTLSTSSIFTLNTLHLQQQKSAPFAECPEGLVNNTGSYCFFFPTRLV